MCVWTMLIDIQAGFSRWVGSAWISIITLSTREGIQEGLLVCVFVRALLKINCEHSDKL